MDYNYNQDKNESYGQYERRLGSDFDTLYKNNYYSGDKSGLDWGDVKNLFRKKGVLPEDLADLADFHKESIGDYELWGKNIEDENERKEMYRHAANLWRHKNKQTIMRNHYMIKDKNGRATGEIDWAKARRDGVIDQFRPRTEKEDMDIYFEKMKAYYDVPPVKAPLTKDGSNRHHTTADIRKYTDPATGEIDWTAARRDGVAVDIIEDDPNAEKTHINPYYPKQNETQDQWSKRMMSGMDKLVREGGRSGNMIAPNVFHHLMFNSNYNIDPYYTKEENWHDKEKYKEYMDMYNSYMPHTNEIRDKKLYRSWGYRGERGRNDDEIVPTDAKVEVDDTKVKSKPKDVPATRTASIPTASQFGQQEPEVQQPAVKSNNLNRGDETERLSRMADRLNNRVYHSGTRGTTSFGQQVGPAKAAEIYQAPKVETEDMRQQGINRELRALTNKMEREGQAYSRQRARQLIADKAQWKRLEKEKIWYQQLGIPKEKVDIIMKEPSTKNRLLMAQTLVGSGFYMPGAIERLGMDWIDNLTGGW